MTLIFGKHVKRRRSNSGFTLVELLVVIAIIGVLIALLLPAVQAAREAARRMQCTNQMKQLALACHNYHDIHQSLPTGRPGSSSSNTTTAANGQEWGRWSYHLFLMPFMEQQPLYDSLVPALGVIKKAGTTVNSNARHPWNGSETGTGIDHDVWHGVRNKIEAFVCPSDIQAKVRTLDEHGVSCYGANAGDYGFRQ